LVRAHSLHGSPSPLSGGLDLVAVEPILEAADPFVDVITGGQVNLSDMQVPKHIGGLIERLAWDLDDGSHSGRGIRGHQLYQKDMIERAWRGGLRLIGIDVIDSRTMTQIMDRG